MRFYRPGRHMFPAIPLSDHLSLSVQLVLLVCGVLAALAVAERLAVALRLRPDAVGTAALLGLGGLFAGERIVFFAQHWRVVLRHPLWMLGLLSVRDVRSFYAGAAIAVALCAGFLLFRRVPLGRAAGALVPAALLLLAFVHAAHWAAGSEPGRVTTARWGVICTRRVAHVLYGTPLHVRLFPVAALLSLGDALLALAGAVAAARRRPSIGFLLLGCGLMTVLAGQLALRPAGEPMLLGVFTWSQAAAAVSASGGALILLRRS